MKNLAVFVSGNGSNLQAIIDAVKNGNLKVNIALALSDNKDAYALARAKEAGIKGIFIDPKIYKAKKEFEREIISVLEKEKVEAIALAGFMRILSPEFISRYKNRILNVHPALLPSFKGAHGIKDAFDYGVKMTGVTIHFVDENMDHGPIILQEALRVDDGDTLGSLEEKIHKVEHKLYPEAIRLFSEGKLKVEGRRVIIL
ncbi:MAG: phosphoribosylglycinamide formyltransferase [Candidatus Omnitrophica bacterium]|nr:phosphoribosylglycinamide formyltransferase [Candidatus Omnitrophota bacterium]